MSQHDYNIANGGGAAVRSDINSALGAIQSLNSGATAPTATVAGMLWYDTLTGSMKQRNAGNTAWVSAADLMSGGQLAGLRNRIMNGKMDIAQRGVSFPAIANGAYTADRWAYAFVTTSVATVTQQADVPSNNEFQNSLRAAITTADASIATCDYAHLVQRIEGFNVRELIGKTFTLSFWVRSSKTGVHCVSLRNSGLTPDRSYVVEYTVSAANTWEQKSITVSGGLILAGTWNWTTGVGLDVAWTLASGATFQTAANAWQTGNFLATANQVNCLDTIGNVFAITGVQLEPGGVATPFEQRPYGMELALCQRYGFMVPINGAVQSGWAGAVGSSIAMVTVPLPVPMRVTPTVPTVAWTLFQASTPAVSSSTPHRVDWSVSGTVTGGSVGVSNSSAFFLPAEL